MGDGFRPQEALPDVRDPYGSLHPERNGQLLTTNGFATSIQMVPQIQLDRDGLTPIDWELHRPLVPEDEDEPWVWITLMQLRV